MTHTITLMANPANANLEPALLDSLMAAWQGQDLRWLSPAIAAEFQTEAIPADFDQSWADLQTIGLDMAVQPTAGRRKQVLLADMDSTMIQQECIDELAYVAGVGDRVAAITARAMNGELNFHQALIERVALLSGLAESVIPEVLHARISLAPGAAQLVATMRAHGAHTALVSGGFTAFTAPVAEMLNFHEHRANTLLTEDGVLTGHVALPVLGREAKLEALTEIVTARGLDPGDVLAVGDGANDLGMILAAGTGVALHAKPAVAAQARLRINHGDLTALLFLQGYTQQDFAAC